LIAGLLDIEFVSSGTVFLKVNMLMGMGIMSMDLGLAGE